MTNKPTICTISTSSHLGKCYALADSIGLYGGVLQILLVDGKEKPSNFPENVHFHFLENLKHPLAPSIVKKYKNHTDKLRWSLKPVFLLDLLEKEEKVVYVDNDILFFDDFNFIFKDLDTNNILLTPHHYPSDPSKNQNWFEANYRVGLYNAGFIGANNDGKGSLEWWAKACLYRCEKNYWRGLFDDQKYLDLLPIIDAKCKVLRHIGCNVAAWNQEKHPLSYKNNKHLVDEVVPVVFYHFNNYSLSNLNNNDPILIDYIKALEPYISKEELIASIKAMSFTDRLKLKFWKMLNRWNGSN